MTRRRNTVNIYDYPEHLNPFRDDVDDNTDVLNTTPRRRPSFRNIFSPNKGKSQTADDINTVSPTATSRFLTWTPKLLRRSFRRSSPNRPDTFSSPSSRSSFRSPASHSTLPPASSRSSLPPPSSLSPNSRYALPPKSTSPPSRPAPPNIRTSLPPMAPRTDHVHSNGTPVPTARRARTSETSAGDQRPEEEAKYIQQGAKPKKKRRAPAPPTSPGKSPSGDTRQTNTNESDASMASSVTSNTAEEPQIQEQPVPAAGNLEVEESEVVHPSKDLDPEIKEEERTLSTNDKETELQTENDETDRSVNGITDKDHEQKIDDNEDKVAEDEKRDQDEKCLSQNGDHHDEDRESSPVTEKEIRVAQNGFHNGESDNKSDTEVSALQNGKHSGSSSESIDFNTWKEMTPDQMKQSLLLNPEPKPRTVFPKKSQEVDE